MEILGIIMFIANIILLFSIILKAKFSYFSLKAIIFNYLLFSLCSQYLFKTSYGILEHTEMPIYYTTMLSLMLIYNVIMCYFIYDTKALKKEKDLLSQEITISNKSAYFCCVIAIVTTFIAMPTIPFLQSGTRFEALLPGNAWNHIAIVALLLAFPKLKQNHLVQATYILVIAWFLAHFERVDIIGLIIGSIILIAIQAKKIPLKKLVMARSHINNSCSSNGMAW